MIFGQWEIPQWEGADSFKEQKMSKPTVHHFEFFKNVRERQAA